MRIVSASHARVQMNFLVAGQHACAYQLAGLFHGKGSILIFPGKRPQVIASQHHPIQRKPRTTGTRMNKIGECLRCLARVSALLVDLAGGRFDKQDAAVFNRLEHGCFDDPRVGRADRVNASVAGNAIFLKKLLQARAGARFMGDVNFHD